METKSKEYLPTKQYGIVTYDECPQLFPYLVSQFYDVVSEFPSILDGGRHTWIVDLCGKFCFSKSSENHHQEYFGNMRPIGIVRVFFLLNHLSLSFRAECI